MSQLLKVSADFERKLYEKTFGQIPSSEDLKHYYKTVHWKRKTAETVKAYEYCCADCGVSLRFSKPNVHHLHYKSFWKEQIGTDVVPLCRECHLARHRSIYTDRVKAPYFDERDHITFITSSY